MCIYYRTQKVIVHWLSGQPQPLTLPPLIMKHLSILKVPHSGKFSLLVFSINSLGLHPVSELPGSEKKKKIQTIFSFCLLILSESRTLVVVSLLYFALFQTWCKGDQYVCTGPNAT